ncbi:MAG: nitroreductase family protein [Oscillospiraceae bacterium]|jgi:nitroreductase|nr:nitroreductase family protein [Oscillospiraceae bacterium]
MTVTQAIQARRSIRRFKKGADITQEQIETMLKAAMMAPSACNTRPWQFIVIKDRAKLDAIASVHPYAKMLGDASLAIVVCALPSVQEGIAEGYFPEDCGACTQNILLAATELGLGSCWCGVYPKEARIDEMREILGIEDRDIVPFNVIVLGVADEAPQARGFFEESKVRYL